jgi:hypothetical protein
MVVLNPVKREMTAKIVYYGPGLCGKTTNLRFIYENLEESQRGKLLALATETDRTLFFDFLPVDMGEVRGFRVRMQLYTVPGQVFYEETRKRVLKGADGVVFVADSQRSLWDANLDSFAQLQKNLRDNGIDPAKIPIVLQYNKRDLPGVVPIEELDSALNPGNLPFFEAMAREGVGVEDTLKSVTRLVLKNLVRSEPFSEREAKPMANGSKPAGLEGASANSTVVMDQGKLLAELGIAGKRGQGTVPRKATVAPEESLLAEDPFSMDGDESALLESESSLPLEPSAPMEQAAPSGEPEELFEEARVEPLLLEAEEKTPSDEPALPAADAEAVSLEPGKEIAIPIVIGGKRCILRIRVEGLD